MDDPNGDVEDFVTWIQRSTAKVKRLIRNEDVPDWVELQRSIQWSFAGKTLSRKDGRWTEKIMRETLAGARKRGHPCKRWSDDINSFLNQMYGGSSTDSEKSLNIIDEGFDWRMHTYDFSRQHWA